VEWEFGGNPRDDPELYERWNPAAHVGAWSTPCLVIHGGLDYRLGEAEGIAAFTALQRRGVPSRMVFFPDESHFVGKPANSIAWHGEVLGWLAKWLKA
jgi:dipeptidyl aminopeptidase/acylaminoacyl peptidase